MESYNNKMFESQLLRELKMPNKYDSTKDEFMEQGDYIAGLTHADVSQLITSFPFIYHIYKKNTSNNQWKLLDYLMKAPSQSDGPGFIYGFMNESENSVLAAPYWIKMGRTNQNPPQNRIFQWERDQNLNLTQIFTVRSLYNKKLQNLVHTLFAYARKKRVLNGKTRVEWFQFDQITLTAAAVNVLNHLMNTIHTSQNKNQQKLYLNRPLKQLTDKITQSNNHMTDICKASPYLIAESMARDLGIQIGRNDQIKIQLTKCQNIIQMVSMIQQFTIGKQLKQCCNQINMAQQIISKYTQILKQFQVKAFNFIGSTYDKTSIKSIKQQQIKKINISINNNKNFQQIPKISQITIKSIEKTEKKSRGKSKKQLQFQKTIQKQIKLEETQKRKPRDKSRSIQHTHQQKRNNLERNGEYNQRIFKSKQKIKKYVQSIQTNEDLMDICNKMQNLKLQQNSNKVLAKHIEQQVAQKTQKQVESIVITYDQNGKQIGRSAANLNKKIKQSNKNMTKYKRSKDGKAQSRYQQNHLIVAHHEKQDLDMTKTQQQINQQMSSMQNRMCQVLQIQRISSLIKNFSNYRNVQDFFIYTNKFIFDIPQLKLDCNFIIMAKNIQLGQSIKIQRGKSKIKGFLRIFCQNIFLNQKLLTIDKNCQKYVGIFKVIDARSIIPLDEHHIKKQTLSQQVKNLVAKYLQIFPN